MSKGKLIVISGPSGAGKGTVAGKLMELRKDLCFSVSVTTRQPRPGEVDGREYFFIDNDAFDRMVENGELLEHARYVSNSYGTPKNYVTDKINEGTNVLLDIEVQGARQVNAMMPEAIMIFLVPPSIEELRRRLEHRGTESEDTICERIRRALQEYSEADFYDYLVVNDDADAAASQISAIITAESCRFEDNKYILNKEMEKLS